MSATPPSWAEALLRVVLKPSDFDSVSGDLLEQYRDSIHPVHGQRNADVWYMTQVFGFVWRGARVWAALFGAAFVIRTALDWLVPPSDFHARSTISTAVGFGILGAAGLWASWRSRSFVAGTVAGTATAAMGAVVSVIGAVSLLAIWHDAQTMEAIRASGGLREVFELPLMMTALGMVLGTIGGVAGATLSRLRSA
jgi:hypothetical protein